MTLSTRHGVFAAYCLGVTVVHWPVLHALFDYSRSDMSASHLLLIPLVACALVFQSRDVIFRSVETARRAGLSVILGALGFWLAAGLYRAERQEWLTMAVGVLVVLWIGGFLLVYGRVAFRAALFPLFFLAFTIPIPAVLLDGAVAVLRTGSTETVAGLFTLTGTPYFREGFVFTLPGVAIEVADECSGIRSSIAMLLTSLLAGHMFLERGWTKALLGLAILPVTILKNGIRIVSLTLLSVHVDPGFLTGQLHHEGGVVFFLMALAILAPVFVLLRRAEIAHATSRRT